jgi:hypothetical protein
VVCSESSAFCYEGAAARRTGREAAAPAVIDVLRGSSAYVNVSNRTVGTRTTPDALQATDASLREPVSVYEEPAKPKKKGKEKKALGQFYASSSDSASGSRRRLSAACYPRARPVDRLDHSATAPLYRAWQAATTTPALSRAARAQARAQARARDRDRDRDRGRAPDRVRAACAAAARLAEVQAGLPVPGSDSDSDSDDRKPKPKPIPKKEPRESASAAKKVEPVPLPRNSMRLKYCRTGRSAHAASTIRP